MENFIVCTVIDAKAVLSWTVQTTEPVDTRRLFNIDVTSYQRRNDVVCRRVSNSWTRIFVF